MAPRIRIGIAVALICVAAAFALIWQANQRADRAERELGLDAARTVSETFAKARELRVATLSGEVIARGSDPGFARLLPSSVTVKQPYRVDYFLDLSRIDAASYRWDAATRTLTLRLPDVLPGKPNLDVAQANRIGTTGIFMSRDAAERLGKQVAVRAALRASASASRREHMDAARKSAREAMRSLAVAPLRAAGLDEVKVVVRFPWEGVEAGAAIPWDESTELNAAYRR